MSLFPTWYKSGRWGCFQRGMSLRDQRPAQHALGTGRLSSAARNIARTPARAADDRPQGRGPVVVRRCRTRWAVAGKCRTATTRPARRPRQRTCERRLRLLPWAKGSAIRSPLGAFRTTRIASGADVDSVDIHCPQNTAPRVSRKGTPAARPPSPCRGAAAEARRGGAPPPGSRSSLRAAGQGG